MSAPFRRPITRSNKSSYLDEFEQNKHTSRADAPPARTLKPPPEIWELVHPVQAQEFKPSEALAARVATKNVLMVTVGIVLASGLGLASWKFDLPHQILAVFAEPETATKKAVPATLKRSTGESTNVASPNSVPPATVSVVSPPTESSGDAVQTSSAVEKKPVHKTSKPAVGTTDVPLVTTSSADEASSLTTPAVRPTGTKTKQQQGTAGQIRTEGSTQATTGQSLSPTGSTKTANNPSDTAATKPKVSAASTGEAAAPPKTNAPPKPKVIQWP